MPTGLRWFAKRRRVLVLLMAATVCLYLVLDTSLTVMLSTKPSTSATRNGASAPDTVVAVNQASRSDGNVNLMLSLNIRSLMKFLDVHTDIVVSKSMTSDPPPPDVDIVQHDPRRCEKVRLVTWLICVHSSAKNGNFRELLRSSWASDRLFARQDTRVVFFVGLAPGQAVRTWVQKEMRLYGDIVQVCVTT